MDYKTRVDIAYWTLLGLIIFGVWLVAGLAVAVGLMRARRFALVGQAREVRRAAIEFERYGRAAEDAYWFLLRGRDARLAQQLRDSRAVVRLVNDIRETRLELVRGEAL